MPCCTPWDPSQVRLEPLSPPPLALSRGIMAAGLWWRKPSRVALGDAAAVQTITFCSLAGRALQSSGAVYA